jgi:hypothetical protein
MLHLPTRFFLPALLLVTAWVVASFAVHSAHAGELEEKQAIRTLIGKTWDKPESKVVIDPIVVDGEYAVAAWTQTERGGRALLRRHEGAWTVILCSGDPLKEASSIAAAGVPQDSADRLAASLASAEKLTDPGRVRLFSTFEGTMKMDGEGQQPPAHHH